MFRRGLARWGVGVLAAGVVALGVRQARLVRAENRAWAAARQARVDRLLPVGSSRGRVKETLERWPGGAQVIDKGGECVAVVREGGLMVVEVSFNRSGELRAVAVREIQLATRAP